VRLAALLCLLAACGDKADAIDWQRMKLQAKAVPYRDSAFFADGRVLQMPPAGAVPRERLLGQPLLTDGLEDGLPATRIPVPVTSALLARGRDRFDVFCAACHGIAGDGDSMVAANMTLRRPPSLLDAGIRAYAPGRIFRVATYGWGLMPAYRTQISVADRWAVVAYVRALQLAQGLAITDLPEELRSEAARQLERQP
jgi:mono/diheme cytochrome c family protein